MLDWQSWPGFDFIFFDCDSTLSTVEGIDELARNKGKFAAVKQLTDAAMDGEVHLQSVYDRRLQLLKPTRAEVRALEQHYRQTVVPDAAEVIAALQSIGKTVFIVSGGLLAAVRPFGMWLGVPADNIRAVELRFDKLSGEWWDYQQDQWGPRPDEAYLNPTTTPLTQSDGKAAVVRELLGALQGRSVLIGDGVSDLAAAPEVDMIVGFGGVITRARVAAESDCFISQCSLAPMLPLSLSPTEREQLTVSPYAPVLRKGLAALEQGSLTLNVALA